MNNTQKGFTLIEMIAVLAIFGIVTSIVLFNHSKFRSDTILVNMAYEMALSIREAQIYGVSVRNAIPTGDSFSRPYGIHIPQMGSQYFLFADTNPDLKYSGNDCAANKGGDICAIPYALQRNILIDSVYLEGTCTPVSEVSILFKRPNPEPIINIGGNQSVDFSRVQITVKASDGAKRYIIIANNGQISVENNPLCQNT